MVGGCIYSGWGVPWDCSLTPTQCSLGDKHFCLAMCQTEDRFLCWHLAGCMQETLGIELPTTHLQLFTESASGLFSFGFFVLGLGRQTMTKYTCLALGSIPGTTWLYEYHHGIIPIGPSNLYSPLKAPEGLGRLLRGWSSELVVRISGSTQVRLLPLST